MRIFSNKTMAQHLLSPETWFYAAIFFSPMRVYGFPTAVGNISFFRIFFIIYCVFFLLKLSVGKIQFIEFNKLAVIFPLLNILFILITLLYSFDLDLSDSKQRVIIKIFGWIVVLFSVLGMSDLTKIKKSIQVYLYSSILPMAIGWYQWFSFVIYNKSVTVPFSLLSLSTEDHATGIHYMNFLRPTSTFLEPNYYAYYLSVISLLVVSQIITGRYIVNKMILVLILFSSFIQMASTLSLSGILSFMGPLMILMVVTINTRNLMKLLFFISMIIITAFIFIKNTDVGSTLYISIIERILTRSQATQSAFGRGVFWNNAFNVFFNSGGLGAGFGSLVTDLIRMSTAHCALLTILAEQGIFAFTCMVSWAGWIMIRLWKIYKLDNVQVSSICLGLLSGFIAILVGNLAYDAMFSYDAMWIYFALLSMASGLTKRKFCVNMPFYRL